VPNDARLFNKGIAMETVVGLVVVCIAGTYTFAPTSALAEQRARSAVGSSSSSVTKTIFVH